MSGADPAGSPRSVVYAFRRDTRVRRAARLVLAERFDQMWSCLPAALEGLAEAGIHEMRVEAKRVRETRRGFKGAYDAVVVTQVLAVVDQLNDRLGVVRDADALVELLADVFRKQPPKLCGAWRDEVTAQRAADLDLLTAHLRELTDQGFELSFAHLAKDGRHGSGHRVAGQRLGDFAPLVIGERLRRVAKQLRAVHGEADIEGLHRARVYNKHLRYTMEAFLGIGDRRFLEAHRRVVELHKALGDIHDLDVLDRRLTAYAVAHDELPLAMPALERLAERRAREYGRMKTFLGEAAIAAFSHAVIDGID